MKSMKLKVYWNKKNGQGRIYLPKRAFVISPNEVEIKVPKINLAKRGRKYG